MYYILLHLKAVIWSENKMICAETRHIRIPGRRMRVHWSMPAGPSTQTFNDEPKQRQNKERAEQFSPAFLLCFQLKYL